LSFNHHHNSPQDLIKKFEGNRELLEEIYFTMLIYENHYDYDGRFLRAIYLANPLVLDKYMKYLIDKENKSYRNNSEKSCFFFELDDYIEVFIKIFDAFLKDFRISTVNLSHYLEATLIPHAGKAELLAKQDTIIRHCIQSFTSEDRKMKWLFGLIAKLSHDRRICYWLLFFEYNQSFEDFKSLPLTPTSWGGVGNLIPLYDSWIAFLNELITNFTGLKWIDHKRHVEKEIVILKKRIEQEQINEILSGY